MNAHERNPTGTAKTTVERASIPGETGAFQTFLKMRQPIDAQCHPPAKTLAAGRTYKYPFTFVVPEQLLPQACRHAKKHGHVERAHAMLPPTLGDVVTGSNSPSSTSRYTAKETSGGKVTRQASKVTRKDTGRKKTSGGVAQEQQQQQQQQHQRQWQHQDDLAPTMCRISYCVRATLTRKVEGTTVTTHGTTATKRKKTIGSMFRKVRIVPSMEEEPPLSIPDNGVTPDMQYCMRKEKDVRRGWTRSKRGKLVVTAAQPKPIEVHAHSDRQQEDVVSSVATLQLRFDPADDNRNEPPPALSTVNTKLTASTYFSAHPWMDFPSPLRAASGVQLGRGFYTGYVPLSTRCVASAPWTKHYGTGSRSANHRDSLYSMSSGSGSESSPSKPFYTASVVIPITVPKNKSLVPTFHSCLISRVYGLDLSVSYNTGSSSKSFLGHTASLRVPIQVTSPGRGTALKYEELPSPALTDVETDAETDEGANTFFSSRRASRRQLQQPPPAYADYRQLPSRQCVQCA